MGKARVVLDSNVLVSAFGWRGNPRRILELVVKNRVFLFVSPQTFEEFSRVLDYPKFGFSQQRKTRLREFVLSIAIVIIPRKKFKIVRKDPKDNKFLECAFACNADFLVTGDFHLLELKEFKKTKIVTPKQFLQVIGKD